MTSRKRLAVIVLNHRTPELVVNCLASLAPELDPQQDVAVVVDNASDDGSVAQLRAAVAQRGWGAWVRLECSAHNRGFSAGNNIGLQAVAADYYWLTNSDTLFRPGAVASLLAALEAHPRAGIIGPRLEWPDGTPQTSCFRYISPISEFLDAARTSPLSRLLRRHIVPRPASDTPQIADWVSFASVVLRHEVVADTGLMDEGYFMYYEDTDYCRRARARGWEILYWPAARVVHLRGGSSPVKALSQARQRRPSYYYAARARYLAKFYGNIGLWGANLLWETGRAIALLRELAGRKAPHTCDYEWRDIWHNWRHPLAGGS